MKYLILIISVLLSMNIYAKKSEFCIGFENGYKSVKGNMAFVPLCPIAPVTPIGSTPLQEGIKAGIKAAK